MTKGAFFLIMCLLLGLSSAQERVFLPPAVQPAGAQDIDQPVDDCAVDISDYMMRRYSQFFLLLRRALLPWVLSVK
jgi:hypothetical protein